MQAQDLLLFQAALGLSDPWQVTSVEFDRETKRLDLRIDFPKGATFCCPECDRSGPKVIDTEEKVWRHLEKAPGNRHEEGNERVLHQDLANRGGPESCVGVP